METFAPERVGHMALAQRVIAALRRAIILGELPPGLHLEEPALAQKFGVSRIPIREALIRLGHEGLVRLEPRRGAFVVGMTPDDLHDTYEFRRLLESHAVRRAAARIDATHVASLQALLDQMRQAVRDGQLQRIGPPDTAFHQQIILAAGNRRLLAAWESIVGLVGTLLSIADTTYRNMPEAVESHAAILRALVEHDADAAERLIQRHLENGELVMSEAMQRIQDSAMPAAGAPSETSPQRDDRADIAAREMSA